MSPGTFTINTNENDSNLILGCVVAGGAALGIYMLAMCNNIDGFNHNLMF